MRERERKREGSSSSSPSLSLSLLLLLLLFAWQCPVSEFGACVDCSSLGPFSPPPSRSPSLEACYLPLVHQKKGYQFQDWSQQKPPQRKVSQEIPLAQKQKSKKSVSERGKKMLSHRFYTLTNSSCCLCCCCCYSCSLCCPY